MPNVRRRILLSLVLLLLPLSPAAIGRERLALRHTAVDLPGPPAKVVPYDLDGDGRRDLLVVVAYSEIQEIGEFRLEEMVQIATVIPAMLDRRELRAYLAIADGGYVEAGPSLDLPPSVLHLEPGPPGTGVVALTDLGVSRLVYEPDAEGAVLRLDPLIEDVPVVARTRSFFAALELVHDLDGDGISDLMLPAERGLAIYRGTGTGIVPQPLAPIEIPGSWRPGPSRIDRRYPLPEIRDIDGDGLPDLVFGESYAPDHPGELHVLLGTGAGRFRPVRSAPLDCHDRLTDVRSAAVPEGRAPWPATLVALRDVDGDGRAEAVMRVERPRGKGLKDAKRPLATFRFHDLRDDLSIEPQPYFETDVVGYTADAESEDGSGPFRILQFDDLDGDGREDLVTLTLEFSRLQLLKVLVTKRLSIGLNFHVYAQRDDGSFSEVPDLDLSEKLKFNLNRLEVGRFAQFAGDFDGDGRKDFMHIGRGETITLHAGRAGCGYPRDPDLAIRLERPPDRLELVAIEDLDGDGRADIRITRPLPAEGAASVAPARLDLYLSGDGK